MDVILNNAKLKRKLMHYREIRPSPPLRSFIESFWILETEGEGAGAPQRVVPDGHAELILNLGDPFEVQQAGQWQRQPRQFLAGQIEGPLLLRPHGRGHIIGIRFRPHGAGRLFGAPMNELAGRFTPVEDLAPDLSRELESALDSANPIARVESTLARAAERRPVSQSHAIQHAVARLANERGRSDLKGVAADFGVSLRQFERRFSASVGLSPKVFCRLQRFVSVFQAIGESPLAWVDAAIDCGYYDQSHLIRDFKEFTGETPSILLAEDADLARHFLLRFGMSHSSNTDLHVPE